MGSRRRRRGNAPRVLLISALVAVLAVGVGSIAFAAIANSAPEPGAAQRADEYNQSVQATRAAEEAAARAAAVQNWNAGLVSVQRPNNRPLTVSIYGDSWTYGMDATSEENTWREIFRRTLEASGPTELTLRAWPGAKAGDMLNSITPRTGIDLSIVALGLTDAFKKTPMEQFRTDYAGLLDKIIAASPATTLMCLGLWQDARTNDYGPYNVEAKQICDEKGGKFVNLSGEFVMAKTTHGPPDQPSAFDDMKSDSTHPNDFGMQVIAYRVLERMPSLVGNVAPPAGVRHLDPSAS